MSKDSFSWLDNKLRGAPFLVGGGSAGVSESFQYKPVYFTPSVMESPAFRKQGRVQGIREATSPPQMPQQL